MDDFWRFVLVKGVVNNGTKDILEISMVTTRPPLFYGRRASPAVETGDPLELGNEALPAMDEVGPKKGPMNI